MNGAEKQLRGDRRTEDQKTDQDDFADIGGDRGIFAGECFTGHGALGCDHVGRNPGQQSTDGGDPQCNGDQPVPGFGLLAFPNPETDEKCHQSHERTDAFSGHWQHHRHIVEGGFDSGCYNYLTFVVVFLESAVES